MMRLNAVVLAALAGAVPAYASDVVVPNAFATTAGGGTFLGQLSSAGRTYQWLIHSDQLTGLVGSDLTGITYRLLPAASAAWPATEATCPAYDLYLSQGVAPADRSATFANNAVGPQTQVRSGPLTIPAGSFPAGAVAPNANEFGMTIAFNQPWHYAGGHLLIELRHPGFVGGSSSVDGINTSNTAAGYLTQFSACFSSSGPSATTGAQSNFAIIRLTASAGTACYANCDESTASPVLNVADFTCFLQKYAAADANANCDGSTAEPTLNVADFTCFLQKYAAGC